MAMVRRNSPGASLPDPGMAVDIDDETSTSESDDDEETAGNETDEEKESSLTSIEPRPALATQAPMTLEWGRHDHRHVPRQATGSSASLTRSKSDNAAEAKHETKSCYDVEYERRRILAVQASRKLAQVQRQNRTFLRRISRFTKSTL